MLKEPSVASEMPGTPPPANRISRSRALYSAFALALAAVLLYFSLRGIHWREVWTILAGADPRFILLGAAISTFSLLLRALRWRVLLRSRAPVDVGTAFWAMSACYFGNNFLPARAGELVRTFIVSRRTGLSKTFVLTTALSERLSDAIALVVIGSVVLLTLPVRPGWFAHAATPFAVVGLFGAAAIAVLPRLERLWKTLLSRIPVPEGMREKLLAILDHILTGIRTFHNAGRLSLFASLTICIWFSDALGTKAGMHALGFHCSLPLAFLLLAGLGLGSALPST
ncbi:MAG: lysylphosphatidylglycerol synthase transmembrane domain-containing protein, partial [Bryobacteraceae bacterium]